MFGAVSAASVLLHIIDCTADRRCVWSSKCSFCSAAHRLLSGSIANKRSGSVADRRLAWIGECGFQSSAHHLLSGSIAGRRCSWSSECSFCSAAHHLRTAVYKAWQIEDVDGALHGDIQLKDLTRFNEHCQVSSCCMFPPQFRSGSKCGEAMCYGCR